MEAKYAPYMSMDADTGLMSITTAKEVVLPADTKLEMVEFVGHGKTSRVKLSTNNIFYFHTNSWGPGFGGDSTALSSDVTLALADVNSISFFAYWGRSIK